MLFGEPEDNAKLIRSLDAADVVRWIREADDRDHTCRNVELQAALLNAFRLIAELQARVEKLGAGQPDGESGHEAGATRPEGSHVRATRSEAGPEPGDVSTRRDS